MRKISMTCLIFLFAVQVTARAEGDKTILRCKGATTVSSVENGQKKPVDHFLTDYLIVIDLNGRSANIETVPFELLKISEDTIIGSAKRDAQVTRMIQIDRNTGRMFVQDYAPGD